MGCTNNPSTKSEQESPKNRVLVVVGPSGVGKDTLMKKLFDKYPNSFQKAVTHTSRAMRPGEEEGKNYYYVSREAFEKLKDEGGFVETNYYNENYYGTSKMELNKASTMDKVMYLIIDINGANSIFDLKIPANFIAFVPKEFDDLKKRLEGRGTEAEDVIQGRVETAKKELERIESSPFFNYKIVNDDLETAFKDLEEKMKILYPTLLKE